MTNNESDEWGLLSVADIIDGTLEPLKRKPYEFSSTIDEAVFPVYCGGSSYIASAFAKQLARTLKTEGDSRCGPVEELYHSRSRRIHHSLITSNLIRQRLVTTTEYLTSSVSHTTTQSTLFEIVSLLCSFLKGTDYDTYADIFLDSMEHVNWRDSESSSCLEVLKALHQFIDDSKCTRIKQASLGCWKMSLALHSGRLSAIVRCLLLPQSCEMLEQRYKPPSPRAAVDAVDLSIESFFIRNYQFPFSIDSIKVTCIPQTSHLNVFCGNSLTQLESLGMMGTRLQKKVEHTFCLRKGESVLSVNEGKAILTKLSKIENKRFLQEFREVELETGEELRNGTVTVDCSSVETRNTHLIFTVYEGEIFCLVSCIAPHPSKRKLFVISDIHPEQYFSSHNNEYKVELSALNHVLVRDPVNSRKRNGLHFTKGAGISVGRVGLKVNFSPFCVELWVYPRNSAETQTILSIGKKRVLEIVLEIEPHDDGVEWRGGSRTPHLSASFTSFITPGKLALCERWWHVALNFTGTLWELWLDGRFVSQSPALISPEPIRDVPIELGKSFVGFLSEIRIWNVPRCATELCRDAHRRLLGNEAGLVSYYPLNEGFGDVLTDYSSSAEHALLPNQAASWFPIPYFPVSEKYDESERRLIHDFIPIAFYESNSSSLFFSVTPNYYTVVSNCAGWKNQQSSNVTIFQYKKENRALVSQMQIDLTSRYRLKGIAYNPMKGSVLCWAGTKEGNPNQLTIWDVHNQSVLPLSNCRSFESIWLCGKDVFSHAANYAQKFISAERYLADQSSWTATLPNFTVDFSEELIPLLVLFAKRALTRGDEELAQHASLLLHVNLFFRYEINVVKLHKEVGPPFTSVAELLERLASLNVKACSTDDSLFTVIPNRNSSKPILLSENDNKSATGISSSEGPSPGSSSYPQRDDIICIAFMPFCLHTQLLKMCCQCFLPTKIQIHFLHTHAGKGRSEFEERLLLSLLDLYSTLQACSDILNDTEAAQTMYCAFIREATFQVDRCLTNNGTIILQRTSRCLEVFQEVLFAKVTAAEENRTMPTRSASPNLFSTSSITSLCIHYTKTLLRTCRKTVEAVLKVLRKCPQAEQVLIDCLECSHVGSLLPSFSLSLPLLPTVVLASCPNPLQSCRETLSALLSTITTGKGKWISDLGIALTFSLSLIGCSLLQAEPEEECGMNTKSVSGGSLSSDPDPEYFSLLRGGKRKKGSERDAIIKNLQQGVGTISKVFEDLQKKDHSALRVVRDENLKRMERNVMASFCALLLPTEALREATPESLQPAFRLVLQMRPWVLSKRQESKEYVSQVEARAIFLSQFESCCKGEGGSSDTMGGGGGGALPTPFGSVRHGRIAKVDDGSAGTSGTEKSNSTVVSGSGMSSSIQHHHQKWRRFFLHWRSMRIQKTLISSQEEADETRILRAIVNFLQSDIDPSAGPEYLVARRVKKATYRLSGLLLVKQLTEEARVSPGLASIVLPVFGKALCDWHYADGVDCCSSEDLFRLHGAYFQLFDVVLDKYLNEAEFLRQPWAMFLTSFFTADMRPLDFRHMRPEITSAFRALWATVSPPISSQDQHVDHTTWSFSFPSSFCQRRNEGDTWRPRRFNNGAISPSLRDTKLTPEMTAQSMTIGESGTTVKSCSGGGRGSCVAPCTWQSTLKGQTYYYELDLVDLFPGASCSVGVGPRDYSLTRLPGWDPSSYALHSDAGVWFVNGRLAGFSFGMGDIVGCGWNVETNEIYWTKNGNFLVSTESHNEEELHPLIGFEGAGMAKINFGEEPFAFAPQLFAHFHGASGLAAGFSAATLHTASPLSPPPSVLQRQQEQLIGQDAWDTFRVFSLRAAVCLQRCTLLLSGVSHASIQQLSSCVQHCFNALSQELTESLFESPGYGFSGEKVQSLLSHTATLAQLLYRVPKEITAPCVLSLVSTLRNTSRIIFSSPGGSANVATVFLTCWFHCMHLYPPLNPPNPYESGGECERSPEKNPDDSFGFLETLIRLAGRLFFIPGSQDPHLYFHVARALRPRMEEVASVALALLQRINYADISPSERDMGFREKNEATNEAVRDSPSTLSPPRPVAPLKASIDTSESVDQSVLVHSWRPALHEWIIRILCPQRNRNTPSRSSTGGASASPREKMGGGSTEKMIALAVLGGGPRHAVPGDTISVYTTSHCITTGTLLSYSLAEELVQIVVTEENHSGKGRSGQNDLFTHRGTPGTGGPGPDGSPFVSSKFVVDSDSGCRRVCKTVPLRVCGLILPDDETHYFPSVGCETHRQQAKAVLAVAVEELEQLLTTLTCSEVSQDGGEGFTPAPPLSSPVKSSRNRPGRHSALTGASLRMMMQSSGTSYVPAPSSSPTAVLSSSLALPPASPSATRRGTRMMSTPSSSLFYSAQQLSSILWRCVTRGVVRFPKSFLATLYRLSVAISLSSAHESSNGPQHPFDVRELRAEKVMTDWLCGAALQSAYDRELSSIDTERGNNCPAVPAASEMGCKEKKNPAIGDDCGGNPPDQWPDNCTTTKVCLLSASLSSNPGGHEVGPSDDTLNSDDPTRTIPTSSHSESGRIDTNRERSEGVRRRVDGPLFFSFPRRLPDGQQQHQQVPQLESRSRTETRMTSASRSRHDQMNNWSGSGGGNPYTGEGEENRTLPPPPHSRRTAFLLLDHSAELDAESAEDFLHVSGVDDALTDVRVDGDDDEDDDEEGTESVRDEDEEEEDEEDTTDSEGLGIVYRTGHGELEEFFGSEEDDGLFANDDEEEDNMVHFSSGLQSPVHSGLPFQNVRVPCTTTPMLLSNSTSDTIHVERGGLRLSSAREVGTKYTIDFYLRPFRKLPRQYIFHQSLDCTSEDAMRHLHFVALIQNNAFECGVVQCVGGGPGRTEVIGEQWMCSTLLPPLQNSNSVSLLEDLTPFHHITVIQSYSTVSIYVEGVFQTSKKMPVAMSLLQRNFFLGATSPDLHIGIDARNDTVMPFIGEIKGFRLYEIAMEASMIEQLSFHVFHPASLLALFNDRLCVHLQVKNRRFVNGSTSAVAIALSLDVLPFGNVGFLVERGSVPAEEEQMCAAHEGQHGCTKELDFSTEGEHKDFYVVGGLHATSRICHTGLIKQRKEGLSASVLLHSRGKLCRLLTEYYVVSILSEVLANHTGEAVSFSLDAKSFKKSSPTCLPFSSPLPSFNFPCSSTADPLHYHQYHYHQQHTPPAASATSTSTVSDIAPYISSAPPLTAPLSILSEPVNLMDVSSINTKGIQGVLSYGILSGSDYLFHCLEKAVLQLSQVALHTSTCRSSSNFNNSMVGTSSLIAALLEHLLVLANREHQMRVYESTHPFRLPAAASRSPHAVMMALQQRYYQLYFDTRCASSDTYFTFAVDQGMTNELAQIPGYALTPFTVPLSRMFFHVRTDSNEHQWGYKVYVVYNCRAQLLAMRLFHIMLSALFYNSAVAGFKERPFSSRCCGLDDCGCPSNADYHFYFFSNDSEFGVPCLSSLEEESSKNLGRSSGSLLARCVLPCSLPPYFSFLFSKDCLLQLGQIAKVQIGKTRRLALACLSELLFRVGYFSIPPPHFSWLNEIRRLTERKYRKYATHQEVAHSRFFQVVSECYLFYRDAQHSWSALQQIGDKDRDNQHRYHAEQLDTHQVKTSSKENNKIRDVNSEEGEREREVPKPEGETLFSRLQKRVSPELKKKRIFENSTTLFAFLPHCRDKEGGENMEQCKPREAREEFLALRQEQKAIYSERDEGGEERRVKVYKLESPHHLQVEWTSEQMCVGRSDSSGGGSLVAGTPLRRGKWYYELRVGGPGEIYIGVLPSTTITQTSPSEATTGIVAASNGNKIRPPFSLEEHEANAANERDRGRVGEGNTSRQNVGLSNGSPFLSFMSSSNSAFASGSPHSILGVGGIGLGEVGITFPSCSTTATTAPNYNTGHHSCNRTSECSCGSSRSSSYCSTNSSCSHRGDEDGETYYCRYNKYMEQLTTHMLSPIAYNGKGLRYGRKEANGKDINNRRNGKRSSERVKRKSKESSNRSRSISSASERSSCSRYSFDGSTRSPSAAIHVGDEEGDKKQGETIDEVQRGNHTTLTSFSSKSEIQSKEQRNNQNRHRGSCRHRRRGRDNSKDSSSCSLGNESHSGSVGNEQSTPIFPYSLPQCRDLSHPSAWHYKDYLGVVIDADARTCTIWVNGEESNIKFSFSDDVVAAAEKMQKRTQRCFGGGKGEIAVQSQEKGTNERQKNERKKGGGSEKKERDRNDFGSSLSGSIPPATSSVEERLDSHRTTAKPSEASKISTGGENTKGDIHPHRATAYSGKLRRRTSTTRDKKDDENRGDSSTAKEPTRTSKKREEKKERKKGKEEKKEGDRKKEEELEDEEPDTIAKGQDGKKGFSVLSHEKKTSERNKKSTGKRTSNSYEEEKEREVSKSVTKDLSFYPFFAMDRGEIFFFNFGGAHFEFEPPHFTLPLDPIHFSLGTLIPYNQMRAFQDLSSHLLTTPDPIMNRTAKNTKSPTLLLSLPSFFSSSSHPMPPFCYDEPDPFSGSPDRAGPAHVSLIGVEGTEVNGLEVKNVGIQFATITADCAVSGGCWYYEVTLRSQGLMQIGWARHKSPLDPDDPNSPDNQNNSANRVLGIGDQPFSWSIDLFRLVKWCGGKAEPLVVPRRWNVGDVIGCGIDLNNRDLHFYFNGRRISSVGGAATFRNIPVGISFSPGISFRAGNHVTFNFGSSNFQYKPEGFQALGVPDTWCERMDTYYANEQPTATLRRLSVLRALWEEKVVLSYPKELEEKNPRDFMKQQKDTSCLPGESPSHPKGDNDKERHLYSFNFSSSRIHRVFSDILRPSRSIVAAVDDFFIETGKNHSQITPGVLQHHMEKTLGVRAGGGINAWRDGASDGRTSTPTTASPTSGIPPLGGSGTPSDRDGAQRSSSWQESSSSPTATFGVPPIPPFSSPSPSTVENLLTTSKNGSSPVASSPTSPSPSTSVSTGTSSPLGTPLWERFRLLSALARVALVVVPFLSLETYPHTTATTRLFLLIRTVLFRSVRINLINATLRDSTVRLELLRLSVNRRLALDHNGNPKNTLFGQILRLLADRHPRMFQTNKRMWNTVFLGEGADDMGGPYRELLNGMCQELMSSDLPFFVPTANHTHNTGTCREAFVPAARATSPYDVAAFTLVGRLMGSAIRSEDPLSLYFPPLVWKYLCRYPITEDDLADIDIICVQCVEEFRRAFSEYEQGVEIERRKGNETGTSQVEQAVRSTGEGLGDALGDATFVTRLSDHSLQELIPGGSHIRVTPNQCGYYAERLLETRLHEYDFQLHLIREGLLSVVPEMVLLLFTPAELEERVCGKADYAVEDLRKGTLYEGITPDDRRVQFLWKALEEATPQQRRLFLRFVSGRERLPVKLRVLALSTTGGQDDKLPQAATCFFAIELPDYSSLEVMKQRLYYSIENCVDMDKDFYTLLADDLEAPRIMVQPDEGQDETG